VLFGVFVSVAALLTLAVSGVAAVVAVPFSPVGGLTSSFVLFS
jgi:hypothetical protein